MSWGPVDYPVLKLSCDLAQHIPADRVKITIGPEETDNTLFLLERLDKAVEQDAVETTISRNPEILP
jgi:hypothetical protein